MIIKKNNLSIIILIFIFLINNVSAELCGNTIQITTNCTMLTPFLNCTLYDYIILNNNSMQIEYGNLQPYGNNVNASIYYFNFTQPKGQYLIQLCDYSTREVYVVDTEQNNNIYYFWIVGLIFILFLIWIGFKEQNVWLIVLSGFLSIIMGISIFFNGFPNINNDLLKNALSAVFMGIGMFLSIAPIVDDIGGEK